MRIAKQFFPAAGLLLVFCGTSVLRAQTPQKLTLAAAFDLAEKQNLDLIAARAQRAVTLAGVRTAGERPNPAVTFGASRDLPHENALLDLPLEIGPKRHRRIELAKQQAAETAIDITASEHQVRRRVREAYFGLAYARGVTQAHSETMQLADRLRQIATARYNAGDIPQLEVIQAELEFDRSQADWQVAQQEEKVALSQLNAVLNQPRDADWDLLSPLDMPPPSLALDALISQAGASNTGLQKLEGESLVEQRRRSLLQAERIPNLGLQAGTDLNAPHDFQVGPRGQLSLEIPLFSRNQGEIAASRASSDALASETAAARRAVAAQVESAFYELESRNTQVSLYREKLVPASRRLAEMAEGSYSAGKSNLLMVLSAAQAIQETERAYLDSLLAMQAALAQLEETVGSPLE